MAAYLIISLFALYGLYCFVFHLISGMKVKSGCGRLILYPEPGDEGLEGKIRSIFMEDVIKKAGTDGNLYIIMDEADPNCLLVRKLAREYSRLVLMDRLNWSRINGRSKEKLKSGILKREF